MFARHGVLIGILAGTFWGAIAGDLALWIGVGVAVGFLLSASAEEDEDQPKSEG